ncbi:hypothetical protein SZ55_1276 [Pseudomonas sp. FeS53a]|nr:hypothetical protein SZ55_1276 [Pseudomonas sp. FeS53a]
MERGSIFYGGTRGLTNQAGWAVGGQRTEMNRRFQQAR